MSGYLSGEKTESSKSLYSAIDRTEALVGIGKQDSKTIANSVAKD